MKKKLFVLCLLVCLLVTASVPAYATLPKSGYDSLAEDHLSSDSLTNEVSSTELIDTIEWESLVNGFADAVNNNDVAGYISLFTESIQSEMEEYLTYTEDEESFFKENSIQIVNTTKLSTDVGELSAALNNDEISTYEDVAVYYAEMYIDVDNDVNLGEGISDEGYNYKVFVIVKENGQWKIYRVSTPNLKAITDAGEGFNSSNEQLALDNQLEAQSEITNNLITTDLRNRNDIALAAIPDSDPTSITVYFTKTANKNYYGTTSKSITWNTYFHNVIPCEWTVDYYDNYPEYLRAGAMATKMYAWYYILTPSR